MGFKVIDNTYNLFHTICDLNSVCIDGRKTINMFQYAKNI